MKKGMACNSDETKEPTAAETGEGVGTTKNLAIKTHT